MTVKTAQDYFYKKLSLPLFALLALVGISGLFFNSSTQSYYYNNGSVETFLSTTICRNSGSILAVVSTVAFILFFAKRSIRSWFAPLTLFFIAGQTLLFFLPAPVIKGEPTTSVDAAFYLKTFLANWQGCLTFFLLALLKPAFFSIVIWGFINQVTRLSEGMKYYIPLAFFSGLSLIPFSFLGMFQSKFFLFGSILCLAATLFVFRSLCKKLPPERWEESAEEKAEPSKTYYALIFAFAFGAFGLMKTLMGYFLKLQPAAGLFSDPQMVGLGVLTLTIPAAYFGYWLLKRKGWLLAVLTPSLIISQAIALSYIFYLLHLFAAELMVINQVLLTTLSSAFLFPVLQIGYLSLPKKSRFSTKAWAEIIFVPLVVGSGPLIVQSLLSAFGSLQASAVYLPPIAISLAVAMSLMLGIIGKRKLLVNQKNSLRKI